ASPDERRGLVREGPDPRQWPPLASWLPYRQAIAELADRLGCDATERAVYERRLATDHRRSHPRLCRAEDDRRLSRRARARPRPPGPRRPPRRTRGERGDGRPAAGAGTRGLLRLRPPPSA